jgi:hypothetical protein
MILRNVPNWIAFPHNNPNYYTGYVLKEMEGSLGKRGDSHAEHNHSSIVVHLGNGGNLNLAEHICQLLERHKNKVLQRRSFEDAQFITSGNYKSKHRIKRHQLDDSTAAKQSLSSHSYKMYTNAFQHARVLQYREIVSSKYVVWPSKDAEDG